MRKQRIMVNGYLRLPAAQKTSQLSFFFLMFSLFLELFLDRLS